MSTEVKVYLKYKFCKHNETFSVIRSDIRLLTFAKFLEFLKSNTVKVGLKIFSFFQPGDMFKF